MFSLHVSSLDQLATNCPDLNRPLAFVIISDNIFYFTLARLTYKSYNTSSLHLSQNNPDTE